MNTKKNTTSRKQGKSESQVDNFDFSKNKTIVDYEQILDTPFTHVKHREKGEMISLGNYQLTEWTEKMNKEELEEFKNPLWNRIVQVTLVLMEQQQKGLLTKINQA